MANKNGNPQNLKVPSSKEARKNGSKGGKASAKARKERKEFKEALKLALTVKMDNTIVIPHLGGSTKESENNCAIQAVRELMDYLENGNINNSVNYPTLDAGICRSVKRITINHYNVSGMISKFANILSSSNINIARMYNNSLDTVAYTILDLDSDISCETLTKLKQIDGVLRVRVLKGAK